MNTGIWLLLAVAAALVVSALIGVASWLGWSRVRWVGYHRHKGLAADPPSVGELAREVWAIAHLTWWRLVALGRDGLRVPEQVRGPAVLCVHGFTQNGTNFWGLRRRLHGLGRPTRAVSLGVPGRAVERYAARLREPLRELLDRFGEIDVVAHSMGGVVLRHVLARDPELARRIRRVVTLGSPHAGTAAARGFALLPEVAQIARRSAWLAELPPLGELLPEAHLTTVAGRGDLVVYPVETCHDPRSVAVDLVGVGHAGLLARPEVVEVVLHALEARDVRCDEVVE